MRLRNLGVFVLWSLLLVLGQAATAAEPGLILDESGFWRRYYRFGADLVSPTALKTQGEALLGKQAFDRLGRETERAMANAGLDGFAVFRPSAVDLVEARSLGTDAALANLKLDPARLDWRDCVFRRMFFDPYTAAPPPANWAAPDFDDGAWVLDRGTFQQDLPNDVPREKVQGNMRTVHIGVLQYIGTGMQAAFYRTRFEVTDPATASDLMLRLVYRGGVRVFVNGQEVARGHLPKGNLAPDTPGDDYALDAYQDETKRDRTLGPLKVPPTLLVKGANVLAVEVRASDLHPVVLTKALSRSWNALHDRESLWRHGYLSKVQLRSAGKSVPSAMERPAGTQVWVADVHHRVVSTEFRMPGEGVGTVRLVGAKNGAYSAQIVVGADTDLAGFTATPGALKQTDGKGEIPASAIRVLYGVPFPTDEFTEKLGDERGLDASFPTARQLGDFAAMRRPGAYVFDHLTPAAPTRVPAGTARPAWITLSVPADAAAGKYTGSVVVAAQRMGPVTVPVELEVVDWLLPEPKDFKTMVACEENPYAVAKFYNVPLWSAEHFRLLEPSFRQIGRIGNTWLNVPVLARTEFGNRDDSPIKWTRKRDGSLAFDYTVLDRYLDLAVKHWGKPRVVMFAVMHGHELRTGGAPPVVNVFDEAVGRKTAMSVGQPDVSGAEKRRIWEAFGRSLYAHMQSKGLEKSMHWGCPQDGEADHELVTILGNLLPEVKWVGGPHQIGAGGYKEPKYYDAFGTVRYFNNWPTFRMNMGWKSPVAHLAIPRIDSSVLSLHTTSHPFAFRAFTDHALGLGRAGICRVGTDEWAAAHYDGMNIPIWIVGMPVLFTLWPGPDGAETGARFEMLLEGIQEGEARIYLEQALDGGKLPRNVAARAQAVLDWHFRQTGFFQNKLCIHALEQYHDGWQERSRTLYRAAAEVAGLLGGNP